MLIWLVNPFDPLPGDTEQEGRYATLARLLRHKGHRVTWWTSSFSHRFKKPVNQSNIIALCDKIGIKVYFLPVPAYNRNVGVCRLWNHYLLAARFRKISQNASDLPDVVLASSPPPLLAYQATVLAKKCGAKVIVDVQDPWPETFYRLAPKSLHPFFSLALLPWHKAASNAYEAADAIVGVADAYVQLALKKCKQKAITNTIPLGVDCHAFTKAIEKGYCHEFTKPQGEIWLAYTGSLNRSYDCLTILYAFSKIRKLLKIPTRLFITGQGELSQKITQLIQKQNISNVTLTGFLDFHRWAYLLSQCDIGFNASFPEAGIYLPNKIFYYFAAGLAVLNTIPGQCSKIIRQAQCGVDYQAGNVDSCMQAIKQTINNPDKLTAMKRNSKYLALKQYDRKILYPQYIDLIEQIGH